MTFPRDNYNSNSRRRNRPLYKDIPFPGQRFLENSHEADIFIRSLIKGYTDRTKEYNCNYYKLGHDLQQSKLTSSRNSCSNTTIEAQEAFPKLPLDKYGNRLLDNFIDYEENERSAKRSSIDNAVNSELTAQNSLLLKDDINNYGLISRRNENENNHRDGILIENECNNSSNFKKTSSNETKMKIMISPRINSNSTYGISPTRPSSAPSYRKYAPHPPTGVNSSSTTNSHSSHSIATPKSFTKVTERKLSLMRGDVDSLFQRLVKPERTQEYDPIVRPSANKESSKPREINPYNKKEKVDFVPEELSSAYLKQYHTAVKLIGSSAPRLSTQSWGDWYWSPLVIEALDEEEQSDSTLSEEIELLIQAMSEVDEKKFHLYFDTSLHLLLELSDELRCPAIDHREFWNAHCHPTSGNFASILSRLTILRDSRALLLELLRVASNYSTVHNKFDYETPTTKKTPHSSSQRHSIDTPRATALVVKELGISCASSSSVTSYSSFPTPTPSVHSRNDDAQSVTYDDNNNNNNDSEEEVDDHQLLLSCTSSHNERELMSLRSPRPPPSTETGSRSNKSKGKSSTSYPHRPSSTTSSQQKRATSHAVNKTISSRNSNSNNNHSGKSILNSQSIGSCNSSDERWRIRAALKKWMKSVPWKVTEFPFHGKNLVDIYIKK